MKQKLTILLIMTLIILTFFNYPLVLSSTLKAVQLFLNKVFPYLFIMIIFNDLLINLNLHSLFKNNSLYIYLLSILTGTPTSSIIITKLYNQSYIDLNTSTSSLLFSSFPNPLFIYSILFSIFNSKFTIFKLLFILYFSSFLMYLFFHQDSPRVTNSNNYFINITSSIKVSLNTCMMVLGVITFYLIISSILRLNPLLSGLLEMTQGLNYLTHSNSLFKEYIALFFLTFQGLSIHTQVKCILDDSSLPYLPFLKGRLIHASLSIILLFLANLII